MAILVIADTSRISVSDLIDDGTVAVKVQNYGWFIAIHKIGQLHVVRLISRNAKVHPVALGWIVYPANDLSDGRVVRTMSAGIDDINDLMQLCEADITSKNQERKQRFLDNFAMVRERLRDLQDRDYKRLLQPCIDGNEIMEMFQLKPSREVGILKQTLKDAVLDNRVPNEREPLMKLLMAKAQEMGITPA